RRRLRERVAEPGDDLKERQVGIGQSAAGQVRTAARVQHAIEVAEKLRRAAFPEILCAPVRLRLLVFVIVIRSDRMVRVVDLDEESRERELNLMRPQPPRRRRRCEAVAHAKKEQDVRSLTYPALPGF